MQVYIYSFAGLYVLGLTYWMVSKGWKITINLFQGKIELEPPSESLNLLKGDGCKPGEEYNRLGNSK
ncbi:MAG: hypothetical protein AAF298_28985 [Cyanobacteria bacterium P01_A01_bin.40]